MTDHTDLLAQAERAASRSREVGGTVMARLFDYLAAALRAETERAAMAARMADAAVNRAATIAAAAREVIAWWDDDTRGGSAEVDALRALVVPPCATCDGTRWVGAAVDAGFTDARRPCPDCTPDISETT
jgi:hypothetical protein